MAHKIVWTGPALRQFDELSEYISRTSELNAESVMRKIISAVRRLETFPMMGRRVPEENVDELREILVFNWRIVYFVSEYEIRILQIIHGAQRWRG
jgi:addiction module RelE/StbE family toxin